MSRDSLEIEFRTYYDGAVYVETVATRDQLINSGFAAQYMFNQLGDKNTRSGPTEYGDSFTLERRGYGRYKLLLRHRPDAQNPYGMANIDPYETDISAILKQAQFGRFTPFLKSKSLTSKGWGAS